MVGATGPKNIFPVTLEGLFSELIKPIQSSINTRGAPIVGW